MRYSRYALCALGCIALALSGCKGDENPKGQAAHMGGKTVRTPVAEAKMTEEPIYHEAIGTVRAEATGVISARTTGAVIALNVREGDRVKQGDPLLSIGDPQMSDRIRQAEAAHREAKESLQAAHAAKEAAAAKADMATTTLQRMQTLVAQNAAPKQQLDQAASGAREAAAGRLAADTAIDAASARLAQAEAAVRIVKADSAVLAPYDGVIIARLIQPGSLANPGTPLLTMEKNEAFRADLSVPDSLTGRVAAGDMLRVAVPDAASSPFPAPVLAVEPTADQQSRTYIVQVKLPVLPELRSGMFVRAYIPIGTAQTILAPESAIVRYGQLTGLFAVDAQGHARFRLVQPRAASEGKMEILTGLRPGERFILHPQPGLADGDLVEEEKP